MYKGLISLRNKTCTFRFFVRLRSLWLLLLLFNSNCLFFNSMVYWRWFILMNILFFLITLAFEPLSLSEKKLHGFFIWFKRFDFVSTIFLFEILCYFYFCLFDQIIFYWFFCWRIMKISANCFILLWNSNILLMSNVLRNVINLNLVAFYI